MASFYLFVGRVFWVCMSLAESKLFMQCLNAISLSLPISFSLCSPLFIFLCLILPLCPSLFSQCLIKFHLVQYLTNSCTEEWTSRGPNKSMFNLCRNSSRCSSLWVGTSSVVSPSGSSARLPSFTSPGQPVLLHVHLPQ